MQTSLRQTSRLFFRTIDAEIIADMCDIVAPSDIVTITGVVKAAPVNDQPGSKLLMYIFT